MANSKLNDDNAWHQETPLDSNGRHQQDPAEEMVLRRAPKISMFLVSGGVLGVVVAFFVVAIQGEVEDYTTTQMVSFFGALFAVIGAAIAAALWMLIDRRSKRNMATFYARRTDNPDSADMALTEDDYSEWSQFQRNQRLEQARRQQFAEAKAQAKAKAKAEKQHKRK